MIPHIGYCRKTCFHRELAPVTEPSRAPIMVEDVLDKVYRHFDGNGYHHHPVTLLHIDRTPFYNNFDFIDS